MSLLLTLSGVGKTFEGGTVALANISVAIRPESFTAIVGPSGCGKSTLLRIIAGLEAPTTGNVLWRGIRPSLGFVFQEATLMPWADALTNAALPLTLTHVARSEREARAAALLEQLGLRGFERAFPSELSGGMRMRVSIARALSADPQVLLMDEPFAALDEFTRQALNDDLIALAHDRKLTVLFVTHSVYESAYLAPDILVMSARPGRIAAKIHDDLALDRDQHWRAGEECGSRVRRILSTLSHARGAA